MDPLIKRLFILLKSSPGNQICCDCSADLLVEENVWCSSNIGVFVCTNCAGVHRTFGTQISRIKSVHMDKWTEEEVKFVSKNGNFQINKVYERYILSSLEKPTPASSMQERKEWIRAKYVNKDFMTPFSLKEVSRDAHRSKPIPLPKRLIDYFGVVGAGRLMVGQNISGAERPEALDFNLEIIDRFPLEDHSDSPLQTAVTQFCFPSGIQLSAAQRDPSFFTFVLTDSSGVKLYGGCLVFYEGMTYADLKKLFEAEQKLLPLTPSPSSSFSIAPMPAWARPTDIRKETDDDSFYPCYSPKSIFTISHYPFFKAMYEFLTQIYRVSFSLSPLPLERYLCNFVSEIPLPPCGSMQVNIPLVDKYFMISRPPVNQLPLFDVNLDILFGLLSCENVLTIFSLLLTEYSVVFCSDYLPVLTPVAESFSSFLFPFWWQGAYIPVLPSNMVGMLDAPVPLIVGCLKEHISHILCSDGLESRPEYVTFVDLDKNLIYEARSLDKSNPFISPKLPQHDGLKLLKKLQEVADIYRPGDAALKTSIAFGANNFLKPITTFIVQEGARIETSNDKDNLKKKNNVVNTTRTKTRSPVGPVSVDALEVREAFLRFFVAILRKYRDCMITLPPPPNDEHVTREMAFNDSIFLKQHPEVDSFFFTKMLQSQMFARFVEERLRFTEMAEVKFLDEKIIEKTNRSTLVKKQSTPFLDNTDMDIKSTFSAPLPDIRDLPRNETYSFDFFPRLQEKLYGIPRPPRQLFTEIETGRAIKVPTAKNPLAGRHGGGTNSVRVDAKEVPKPTYSLDGNVKKSITVDYAIKGVIRIQTLYRRWITRKKYKTMLKSGHTILRFLKKNKQRLKVKAFKIKNYRDAVLVQSVVRMFLQKRRFLKSVKMVICIQAFIRMSICLVRHRKWTAKMVLIQKLWRGWRQQRKYAKIRNCVRISQALVRGFNQRRRVKKFMYAKVREIRANLSLLWERASTPLLFRAKFWVLFKEPYSYLDLAVYKEEFMRLNKLLLVADHASVPKVSPGTHHKASSVARKPSNNIKVTGRLTDIAAHQLAIEKHELYLKMKTSVSEAQKESIYSMFKIDLKAKEKKRHLVDALFSDPTLMDESSQMVLSTMDREDNKRDWVETLRDQRIKANLVYTCNATLHSFKKLYNVEKERKREIKELMRMNRDLKKKLEHTSLHHC